MSYILWECEKHGMVHFSVPNTKGQSICFECYKETPETCDCLWDFVPLRGPADDCNVCLGTGAINFTGTIVRF